MFNGAIRELKSEDIEGVGNILGLYWSGELKDRFLKRLKDFVARTPESIKEEYKCFVAEENKEVVGIAVFRKVPEHMRQYANTDKAVEFYLLAAKYKSRGIGRALGEKELEEAKKEGFTEGIFYSAESHKDSWGFYDKSNFKRTAPATAPNGEAGYIWRMDLR